MQDRRWPVGLAAVMMLCALASGCQSTGTADVTQLQENEIDVAGATSEQALQEETAPVDPAVVQAAVAADGQIMPAAAQCTIALAGGPPPKPAKGADFGKAVAKDTGKTVGRNILTMIGGQVGGQLGAAVAGGVANSEIRAEADIKGTWQITDGTPNCACQLEIGGLWKIQGKGRDSGTIKPAGCTNPAVQQVANWALGYSFTGYNAKFELKAKDKRTVLATMNRDGIHYFSGTLADGTPVVMWRDGQNYSSFRKSAAQ
ncbi:MAG: hypothetical protein VYD64_10420 [Pseudomonadota bacterium]|nr:hypothetical protein [Pseudomonadota bacterium]